MASIIDANYAAYAANDLEGVLATLADDYTVSPFGGSPWLTSRDAASKLYTRHLVDYPKCDLGGTIRRPVKRLGLNFWWREATCGHLTYFLSLTIWLIQRQAMNTVIVEAITGLV